MKSSIVLAALVASALLAPAAAAETKSWAAVKGRLPASTAIVVGVDVKAIRGLSAFPALLGSLYSESREAKQTAELVKSACGFDLPSAIADVTIVANLNEKGAIVIGLDGLDQTKLIACAGKVLQKTDPKLKLTARPGKVTEYAVTGEPDKLYAAWLASDVVAIGTDPRSRALLDALLAGKPAGAELAGYVKNANTAALLWGAAAVNKDGIKGGAGSITSARGTLAIAVKVTAATAAGAKEMAAEGKKKLARTTRSAEQSAPNIAKLLKLVVIEQRGAADLAIEASVPEAELPALLPAFDKMF